MITEKEFGIKARLLNIMRALLDRPHHYTKRKLAEKYSCSKDTISHDFDAFNNAGFVLDYDTQFRYAFLEEQPFKQLNNLLHFSEQDQFLLEQAIDQISPHSKHGKRLQAKLSSLYNYRKLGYSYLRKPYLTKVDLLEQAKKEKKVVCLVNYRSSNSNVISNRYVEAFHPNPADDMLHTFDIEKKMLRHFRISRFQRVKITEDPWQYESHHRIRPTDAFRIVNDNQVMVHLRLGVGAYNELVERFPLAGNGIQEAAEEGYFDFQGKVNEKFLGITNFILGHYHQEIEVLEPDSLIEHLNKKVEGMRF